jgi:MarR family
MISLKTVSMEPVAKENSGARAVYDVASGGDGGAGVGGKLMVTRGTGRRVREVLGEVLEGLPGDGVLYVDTRGVELMDYSFADEALGILVSRVAAGEYGDRHVALIEEDREMLENIEASLRQRGLAMIRVDEPGGAPKIVGEVPDHLLETLHAIYEAGAITNADLAERLGINHTACNNRATKLFKLGLIHRRKNTAAPGGRQYSYEGIA